jgi:hypothetical protein
LSCQGSTGLRRDAAGLDRPRETGARATPPWGGRRRRAEGRCLERQRRPLLAQLTQQLAENRRKSLFYNETTGRVGTTFGPVVFGYVGPLKPAVVANAGAVRAQQGTRKGVSAMAVAKRTVEGGRF